jgi:hypothetical protein
LEIFSMTGNDSGRFSLGNLRPGDWYAFAFSGAPSLLTTEVLRERIFNTGLWRQAATARVAEGETASLKLTITPWVE